MLNSNDHLRAFFKFSADIGSNFELVQGAGGNTSFKLHDSLFIKGSGFELRRASDPGCFVEVGLSDGCVRSEFGRPSIELPMHLALPHRVGVHLHCVDTLAWAVTTGFLDSEIFTDNEDFCPIGYAKPGVELAEAVRKVVQNTSAEVFLLQNHGLLFGADDVAEARHRLQSIRERVKRPLAMGFSADIDYLRFLCDKCESYVPSGESVVHDLAFRRVTRDLVAGGVPYPDHAVFLGTDLCVGEDKIDASSSSALIVIPDRGALVRRDLSWSQLDMIKCLGMVGRRLRDEDEVNFLSDQAVRDIASWEAERYRKRIGR